MALEAAASLGSNRDYIAKRAEKVTRHGHKRRGKMTPEYRTWLGMKRRCYDAKYKDYANWGGRGIRMCDAWLSSFEAFLRDMGNRPSARHSIDRINPNSHYSPENCRWATEQQQGGEHKRSNIAITVDGITFDSLAAACRHFGVMPSVAQMRIKAGIPAAVAVSVVGRLPARRSRESYLPRDKR